MKYSRTYLAIIVVSCIACLSGCSSDDDLNPIIGTWSETHNYSFDWINCIDTTVWTISKDGTLEKSIVIDGNGDCIDQDLVFSGTWDIANGLFNVNFTDYYETSYYYFITSTGQLSLNDEEHILERQGSGTGIVGAWLQEDEECYKSFTIFENGTYDYGTCEEEFSGNYVTSGDHMTTDVGTEYEAVKYFKIFGNYLAINDEEDLLTRQ